MEAARFKTVLARAGHHEQRDAQVAQWAAQHDLAALERMLNAAEVPATRIFTLADIYCDPHYKARHSDRRPRRRSGHGNARRAGAASFAHAWAHTQVRRAHRPAHNSAAVQIHVPGQMQPVFRRGDLRDVGHPRLVRLPAVKASSQKIGRDRFATGSIGTHPVGTLIDRTQSLPFLALAHPLVAHSNTARVHPA